METTLADAAAISMLHPEALAALSRYARESRGGILEIGPYIGGSTVAIALGNAGQHAHVAMEAGGAHPTHPSRPSNDIVADWRANIDRLGLTNAVTLCQGSHYDAGARQEALATLRGIGLLFVDADGNVASPMQSLAQHMRPGCLLCFDDYLSDGAPDKQALTHDWIDYHAAEGRLVLDVVIAGTWFGRVSGAEALTYFSQMPVFRFESGFAFVTPVPNGGETDEAGSPTRSTLRLFEDGVEIGPSHAPHADIRTVGRGRYSHWASDGVRWLYFSASDNSDPNVNGRRYEADSGSGRMPIGQLTSDAERR